MHEVCGFLAPDDYRFFFINEKHVMSCYHLTVYNAFNAVFTNRQMSSCFRSCYGSCRSVARVSLPLHSVFKSAACRVAEKRQLLCLENVITRVGYELVENLARVYFKKCRRAKSL